MSSLLPTLYDDLAAMAVTYTPRNGVTKTPKVFELSEMPNSIQTAQMPCRVLLPPGPAGMNVQAGNGVTIPWVLTDLFLLDTIAQGQGAKSHADAITRYCAAYAESIAQLWRWPTYGEQIQITDVNIAPSGNGNPIEYPAQSGVYFFGVRVTIVAEEFLV